MSALGDLLGSIGTGKAVKAPLQSRPTTKPLVNLDSRPKPTESKSDSSATISGAAQTPNNGIKRKAENDLQKLPDSTKKLALDSKTCKIGSALIESTSATPLSLSKLDAVKSSNGISRESPTPPAVAKPPPKGSYAEMMARAKATQANRGQAQVGMIKHQQAPPKEKVSKVAQKRREEEEEAKKQAQKGQRPGDGGRVEKRRSASPQKKALKPPAPPLSAPARPTSAYKGTMGTAAKRPLNAAAKKNSRYDDYLGTDEEDEGDFSEEEQTGYMSDASSDMEAGAFDIDQEENLALRHAKVDDAKELELENRLKREKLDRKRKLQAMADKHRK